MSAPGSIPSRAFFTLAPCRCSLASCMPRSAAIAFGPTWVYFRPYRKSRRMPLLLGFALIALFIWAAENIGTFTTVWLYPHQAQAWELVRLGKYGSWFLLMIISFILVSVVNRPRPPVSEAEGSATLLGAARAERRSLP